MTITAAPDAAVGLDVGASAEYEHWNAGVPFNLGGGGTVEDVVVVVMAEENNQLSYKYVMCNKYNIQ